MTSAEQSAQWESNSGNISGTGWLPYSTSAAQLHSSLGPLNLRLLRTSSIVGQRSLPRIGCFRIFRFCTTRKMGVSIAAVLASISLLMMVNGTSFMSRRPDALDVLARTGSVEPDLKAPTDAHSVVDGGKAASLLFETDSHANTSSRQEQLSLIEERDDAPAGSVKLRGRVVTVPEASSTVSDQVEKRRPKERAGESLSKGKKVDRKEPGAGGNKATRQKSGGRPTRSSHGSAVPKPPPPPSPPFVPYETDLPDNHMCSKFAYPPPPPQRRGGFRPCAVCYLPLEDSVALMPPPRVLPNEVVRKLTYITEKEDDNGRSMTTAHPRLPRFGGNPTLEDRAASFDVRESMEVHCGFATGTTPGLKTGFDIDPSDLADMAGCRGVVVASAIFGSYDLMSQPSHMSEQAKRDVCFFMFLDEQTHADLVADGTLASVNAKKVGLWRVVRVTNLPYTDPRRNGKVPKLLLHRLFPNVRFSLWVDGKLQLVVDPYRILERFLWRHNQTWAISRHYQRFDIFEEAEANKAAGKYDNSSIDRQINAYREDGMVPYTAAKLPITSDVPEGCTIIREHTPLVNLMSCLWFNEVDRFTSRDQLSFGYVRDKLMKKAELGLHMFQDCERRNFVVQNYHKDLLLSRLQKPPGRKPRKTTKPDGAREGVADRKETGSGGGGEGALGRREERVDALRTEVVSERKGHRKLDKEVEVQPRRKPDRSKGREVE